VTRRKYPSFDKMIVAAKEIVALWPDHGPVLIGGMAMQMYGSPRLTEDVDLAAKSTVYVKGGMPLSFGGVRTKASNGIEVDIIERSDKWSRLYTAAINASRVDEETSLRYVSAEFLATIKMASGREKDLQDLTFLLTSDGFNYKACEILVDEFLGPYAVDDLVALNDEAIWEKSRRDAGKPTRRRR
jgi:hypothetical protein